MSKGICLKVRKWSRLFLLYFHTLRYLRFTQFLHRFSFFLKFKFYRYFPTLTKRFYAPTFPGTFTAPTVSQAKFLKGLQREKAWPEGLDQTKIIARPGEILKNRFFFLNHACHFPEGIGWNSPSVSRLWRYQLHYFDYAWDLGVAHWISGDPRYYDKFRELAVSWIAQNPVGQLDGWHPYTISLRVVNWVYAYEFFKPKLTEDCDFCRIYLEALFRQCSFLSGNLEFYAYGNHLMANIKALIFGGVFFDNRLSRRWLRKGLKLLQEELEEQILEDGGHFERSPMYHMIVMKDLIECSIILGNNGFTINLSQRNKLRRMADFAEALLTPAGCMPLFGDSARNLMPESREIISLARWVSGHEENPEVGVFSHFMTGDSPATPTRAPEHGTVGLVALANTGYFVLRGGKSSVMFLDCGPICPDYLPAHAHADTLSYEFWLNGVPFITDSGVYEYKQGVWRDFFRSTRAHSTVTVDGEDQSEVWGSFRVAKRAYPQDRVWISTGGVGYFSGGHSGYGRLPQPAFHHRKVLHFEDRFWLILDRITGSGCHCVESFIHLHPEVEIQTQEPARNLLWHQGQTLTLFAFDGSEIGACFGRNEPPQGWYSTEFGMKEPRYALHLEKTGMLPLVLGYILISGQVGQVRVEFNLDRLEHYEVYIEDQHWSIEVDPRDSNINLQIT